MKTGQVVDATLNHTPGEGNESELLLHMAAVSKACQKRDKKAFFEEDDESDGEATWRVFMTRGQAPDNEVIKEVLQDMNYSDTSDEHIAFLHKAFDREKLIESFLPSGKRKAVRGERPLSERSSSCATCRQVRVSGKR